MRTKSINWDYKANLTVCHARLFPGTSIIAKAGKSCLGHDKCNLHSSCIISILTILNNNLSYVLALLLTSWT